MSTASFSTRTRNAGQLDADGKLISNSYGSFRSINKFDPNAIPRSKHDDIFKDEQQFDIEPVKEMPPQPPKNTIDKEKNEEKKEKKKTRRRKDDANEDHHHHHHRDGRRRSSSRTRTEKDEKAVDDHNKEDNHDQEADKFSRRGGSSIRETKNEDDEIFESLKRHRRRRQQPTNEENGSNQDNSREEKENRKEEKLNEQINLKSSNLQTKPPTKLTKAESQREIANNNPDKEVLKHRRNNSFVKQAFEGPESIKHDSESEGEADDAKIDIDKSKPKQQQPDTQNMDPEMTEAFVKFYKSLREGNTIDFILTPPPQNQTINCKVICKKGIFNEYYFYVENISKTDLLIMKAHRKVTSAKSYYTIDTINYDLFGNATSTSVNCSRIVSNISRKKFKLDLSTNFVMLSNNEILDIGFKSNVGEPRKIIAQAALCAGANNSNQDRVTYFLKNRQPVFDQSRRKFVLNYNGRAKRSSKNNFQIVDEAYPEDSLMQLGKVETTIYNCDFAFPLCALQAFGFALSSLCR